MFSWVIRLLLVVLILRLITGLVVRFVRARGGLDPAASARGKREELVRDPVCGTYVEPSRALSARTGSTMNYFCSERCRQVFGDG